MRDERKETESRIREAAHGVQPFWFWNGEMRDEEIVRQIHEMKEQGLHGFMIHPRQGLEVPYLSRTFFEKVRLAVMTAKECGLEVWLYDEFPYPSGISGGRVTLEHPEYCCKELVKTTGIFLAGETAVLTSPMGGVVAATAYPYADGVCDWEHPTDLADYVGTSYAQEIFQYSGMTKYNKKRYFQGELMQKLQWQVPDGCYKIYLFTEVVMRNFKYFETFIDPLKPEAVRCFLETTHEEYKKYIGDEFGKTVKGVFTDEVTAFPPGKPWSDRLPALVKERHGIELAKVLPALTEDMGPATSKIRIAYWETVTSQFIESWDKQIYGWCEENHLMAIGEKPILRSAQLRYMHVPGVDCGHQKFGARAILADTVNRFNGKIASSAAHLYGKPAALCEAFHSIGWSMNLQDAKWIFDWLTVHGINFFSAHGAYYTAESLKKHDAPPSVFYQMPWWKEMHELTAYTEKLNGFLLAGNREVPVLLLEPVTTGWTKIGEELAAWQKDFADLQNALLRAGVDYYVIDPITFAEGTIEADGCYSYHGERFPEIVLPLMENLEEPAAQKILELAAAGGSVTAVGSIPEELAEAAASPALHAITLLDAPDAVKVLADRTRLKNTWQVRAKSDEILHISRKDETGKSLFVTNIGKETETVELSYLGGEAVDLTLAGGESRFLDRAEYESLLRERKTPAPVFSIDFTREITLAPCRENALRIDRFLLHPTEGPAHLPADGRIEDRAYLVTTEPVINQYQTAGIPIDLQTEEFFGCPKKLSFPDTAGRYGYRFLDVRDARGRVRLVMERTTLLGEWHYEVNGHAIFPADFEECDLYMPQLLAADITEYLTPGENELALILRAEQPFGGIRNPIYLFGDFAVGRITENAEDAGENESAFPGGVDVLSDFGGCGSIADLSSCGLPFYAGRIRAEYPIGAEEKQEILRIADESQAETITVAPDCSALHESFTFRVGEREFTEVFAPYTFQVKAEDFSDADHIEILYDTSMSRLFEGERFDEINHRYVPVLPGGFEREVPDWTKER